MRPCSFHFAQKVVQQKKTCGETVVHKRRNLETYSSIKIHGTKPSCKKHETIMNICDWANNGYDLDL